MHDRPETISHPARALEVLARALLCASLAALLYVVWTVSLPTAAAWTPRVLRLLPRVSVFLLGMGGALCLQGAAPRRGWLLFWGLAAALASLWLFQFAEGCQLAFRRLDTWPVDERAGPVLSLSAHGPFQAAGAVVQLLRFECALFAAILLGTWLGGGVRTDGALLALILCAGVGELWLGTFRVADSAAPGEWPSLLRLPFPPALGRLSPAPHFTDVLFAAAFLEGAGQLRLPKVAVFAGALAGYCSAAFLAAGAAPGWRAAALLLCGSGVLLAVWPELRCTSRQAARAFLISALLLAGLMGVSALHRTLHRPVEPPPEPLRYGNVT